MKVESNSVWMIPFPAGLVILLMASLLAAQAPGTGAISGQVFDPSGAVIANARVTAMNEETGSSREVAMTLQGWFHIPLLPPGDYSLLVAATGFQSKTLRSIQVTVTETAVVNVKLDVASAAGTKIDVSAAPELAQTQSSALGRVTDANTIVSLPLANRNFSQILALDPGVMVAVPDAGALGKNTQNVSADGAKTTSNNFQFNGVDANNISENSFSSPTFYPQAGIAVPSPDTIAEFKAQTGMYDANYGRGAGANVDLVSKEGTNKFHGSLWEFFRNDALNANDFFLKRNGEPRPVLKQNQFGGSFGGPIEKNRTFFFASYQATIQRDGDDPAVSLVSTFLPPLTNDRSRQGLGELFGGQQGSACPTPPIPSCTVAADGSNINSVALKLLNFKLPDGSYAIPNPQTILPGGAGQSTYSIPATYREDQFSVNLDHKISGRNQLASRFFYSRAPVNEPFNQFAATVPGFGSRIEERNDMFVLSDTHAFAPNLVNVARFGFMRFNGIQNAINPINGADVGMQTAPGQPGIPGILVLGSQGAFAIGPPFQPTFFENTNTFVWQDTVSLTRGRHNVRIGGEAKRHQLVPVPSSPAGFLEFLSFPDFLLGENGTQNGSGQSNIFNSSGGSGNFRKDERYTDFASFVQDDFKVTPRLTVNAGLRYEYFGPPTEVHGTLSNFDPTLATAQVPLTGSLSGFVVPSNFQGALASGVTRNGYSGMWNAEHKDLGPRFGFALRLHDSPTVVLRGGYGIYYERLSGELAYQSIGQVPFSVTQSLQGEGNAAATLQEPFNPPLPPLSAYPIYIPRVPATANSPGSALFLQAISQQITSPYTQQYNLNVQHEFMRDFLWQLGYVGSKTTHQTGCVQFNQSLLATAQHPVNGQTTTTVENVALRSPFAGIAGGSFVCNTEFDANYNSLQASILKRTSHGLELQGSYTFSKNLDFTSGTGGLDSLDLDFLGNDQTKPRQSRGLNDFDRKHRFVLSFVYQSPKLHKGPSMLQYALSHWQVSGLSVLQSGLPITAIDSTAGSVYGNLVGFNRAECTGGANPASSGSLFQRLNGYFNPAAFAAPPAIGDGTGFGNCGVGILRGPSQLNLDLGIQRGFSVTETSSLQFRAEFFNFTNTPKFGLPVNDRAAGGAFGVISSSVSNPRIVQFALKYAF